MLEDGKLYQARPACFTSACVENACTGDNVTAAKALARWCADVLVIRLHLDEASNTSCHERTEASSRISKSIRSTAAHISPLNGALAKVVGDIDDETSLGPPTYLSRNNLTLPIPEGRSLTSPAPLLEGRLFAVRNQDSLFF